jgi:zinc transporter, ZIP family
MDPRMAYALLASTLAGLATILGALPCFFTRCLGPRLTALSMGFAGGVMLFVSFGGLLFHSQSVIGMGVAYVFFLAGLAVMLLLDVLVPHDFLAEKHEAAGRGRVHRAGVLTALGIGIHNVPEGMAVFVGMAHDTRLGWAVALAIALHNIPEGLAISAPIYASTGSRMKALGWTTLAALAEPAGAILAAAVLFPWHTPTVMAATLAATAGLMVYIALDELLPAAREEGGGHLAIAGTLAGMAVMAGGLWALQATGAPA